MNASSQDNFAELLAYKQPNVDAEFADRVMEKISRKRKARKRLLVLAGIGAALTTALLVGASSAESWQPVSEFISQSPMLITSAIVVGLLSGLLIRAEEM